jgi:hypothetical protein
MRGLFVIHETAHGDRGGSPAVERAGQFRHEILNIGCKFGKLDNPVLTPSCNLMRRQQKAGRRLLGGRFTGRGPY